MANTKIIVGGGGFAAFGNFNTPEIGAEFLQEIAAHGIKDIDTAEIYPGSEDLLGDLKAPSKFIIDSKAPGGFRPEPSTKESVIDSCNESLKKLKADSVNIYYIHAPERRAPMEPIYEALNELYKEGKFKKLGLSNFSAAEVDEAVRFAKEKNYVVPSVYQGNYSAIARRPETELLPTLRRHNIAYYAYSPIAGGFLTKTSKQLTEGGTGRWDPSSQIGGLYSALYKKPELLKGLDLWNEISVETGISRAELAYRWVAHNSNISYERGDGVIIGSSSIPQFKEAVAAIKKGPLSTDVVAKIEKFWQLVKDAAPMDNYQDTVAPK